LRIKACGFFVQALFHLERTTGRSHDNGRGAYEKGIKLAAKQVRELEARLQRSTALKWWDIAISPKKVF
jgi:hypothetical protein